MHSRGENGKLRYWLAMCVPGNNMSEADNMCCRRPNQEGWRSGGATDSFMYPQRGLMHRGARCTSAENCARSDAYWHKLRSSTWLLV